MYPTLAVSLEVDCNTRPGDIDNYHLAWAHRTLITRKLKGLEELIREFREAQSLVYQMSSYTRSFHRRISSHGS